MEAPPIRVVDGTRPRAYHLSSYPNTSYNRVLLNALFLVLLIVLLPGLLTGVGSKARATQT